MGVVGVGGVELASVVRQLRAELNEALEGAEGERLRFELGPVEMSLRVTVGQEAAPGAKVRFWVIEASADAKLSRESVQEIKLVLTPVDTQTALGGCGWTSASQPRWTCWPRDGGPTRRGTTAPILPWS